MRVAFLVTSFPTISETFILDQVTGLLDLGCDVEIFPMLPEARCVVHPDVAAYRLLERRYSPQTPERYAVRPVRALALATRRIGQLGLAHARALNFVRHGAHAGSLRLFFEAVACAARPPFDVIHCHFGPNGLRGLALRDIHALRGPLVTSFYGYDVSEFPRQRSGNPYARLFARGDLFLALSESMGQRLLELGCDETRLRVHRLGIRPELFSPPRGSAAGRPLRILSIGRLVPKKGLESALRAVAALAAEHPDLEYRIVGDGPLRARLEQLADQLHLRAQVHFDGWSSRPEISAILQQSEILLAPSVTSGSGDQEGTPVVIMEALAAGVPVVSTRHAGIPEVVDDGVSGYLAPEHDVPALSGALSKLARDPGLRETMGRAGRLAMSARHNIELLNRRLLGYYRELVAGESSAL